MTPELEDLIQQLIDTRVGDLETQVADLQRRLDQLEHNSNPSNDWRR